jgi:hypothetical protein
MPVLPQIISQSIPKSDTALSGPTLTPPQRPDQQALGSYKPPPVRFSLGTRADSDLSPADFDACMEIFTKNARVLRPDSESLTIDVGVIMYTSLPGFYNWYSDATKLIAPGSLRFNLIDINWRPGKVFVLPEGQPEHFRMLKQHIWDLFWLTSSHKPGPLLFRIAIYPLPATSDYANKESSKAAAWNTINSKPTEPTLPNHNLSHPDPISARPPAGAENI